MNQPLSERLSYHITLLNQVKERMLRALKSDNSIIDPEILQQLDKVIEQLTQRTDSAYEDGQSWLLQILTHQPQLTPVIDRDLLWFFGGECLHFMADDEIELFQSLDEQEAEHDGRNQAEGKNTPFDRIAVKTLLQQTQQSSADQKFDA